MKDLTVAVASGEENEDATTDLQAAREGACEGGWRRGWARRTRNGKTKTVVAAVSNRNVWRGPKNKQKVAELRLHSPISTLHSSKQVRVAERGTKLEEEKEGKEVEIEIEQSNSIDQKQVRLARRFNFYFEGKKNQRRRNFVAMASTIPTT
ncbi:hypothetical protein PIB30_025209 [Stylosanthes scabra]|uniref:Uncharacterized protein n=1 Tax=Stylosanthes scabra TaxID=79078 RepID=A0ABU6QAD9_9FABA|nr:hypothetical protein [Stylosanthes scabra]